jgi:siroheme synthase
VRLKGGDPMVFGRGGEEAQVLRDAGIAYEFVPGVSAAIAAAEAAGIPVTHRDHSPSVTIASGYEAYEKGGRSVDWEHLARHRHARPDDERQELPRERRAPDRRRPRPWRPRPR